MLDVLLEYEYNIRRNTQRGAKLSLAENKENTIPRLWLTSQARGQLGGAHSARLLELEIINGSDI